MKLLWGIPRDTPIPTYIIPQLFMAQATIILVIAAIIATPVIQPGVSMSGITPGLAGDSGSVIPAALLDSPLDSADGTEGDGGGQAGTAGIDGAIAMVIEGGLQRVTEPGTEKVTVTPHEEIYITPRVIRQG